MNKVSVIVPVYNTAEFLERCLDSLIEQKYSNLEIICVDNNSTDNSLILLKKYKSKFNTKIIIANQKLQGLSATRNKGLELATGDFITFVDSDDWLSTDAIEQAIKYIDKYDVDLVMWPYIKVWDSGKEIKQYLYKSSYFMDCEMFEQNFYLQLFGKLDYSNGKLDPSQVDRLVTATCKLYRKELIGDKRFVDTNIIGTEDLLFNIQVCKTANKAFFLDSANYYYWKSNELSLTSIHKVDLEKKWDTLYSMIESFTIENKLSGEYLTYLSQRRVYSLIGLGLNEIYSDRSFFHKYQKLNSLIRTRSKDIDALLLKDLKLEWKLFFFVLKFRSTLGYYILLKIIRKIIGK